MRKAIILALAMTLAGACSSGSASFAVTQASADPTYWCPGNASNAPYDINATARLHNPTSSAVKITGVTAQMELEAVKGPWLEKVGDVYNAGDATFTPDVARANSDTTLKVIVHSACTSPAYGESTSDYGDYRITFHIRTSAGSYSISSENLHRILTA